MVQIFFDGQKYETIHENDYFCIPKADVVYETE